VLKPIHVTYTLNAHSRPIYFDNRKSQSLCSPKAHVTFCVIVLYK